MFRDYLYIDSARLASYVDQLGSPKVREKVPKWTVQLGTTPVSGTQDQVLRDPTQHERVERLLAGLRKQRWLDVERITGRNAFNHTEKVFRLETCRASNIFLPGAKAEDLVRKDDFLAEEFFGESAIPRREPGFHQSSAVDAAKREAERRWRLEIEKVRTELAKFKGVSLWWSDSVVAPGALPGGGQLFLVANSVRDDSDGFGASSAFTALSALFFEIAADLRRTTLHAVEPRDVSATSPSSLQKSFLADPLAWFRTFGAQVGGERTITTLYRIRETVLYRDRRDDEAVATIGYPMFIVAGSL